MRTGPIYLNLASRHCQLLHLCIVPIATTGGLPPPPPLVSLASSVLRCLLTFSFYSFIAGKSFSWLFLFFPPTVCDPVLGDHGKFVSQTWTTRYFKIKRSSKIQIRPCLLCHVLDAKCRFNVITCVNYNACTHPHAHSHTHTHARACVSERAGVARIFSFVYTFPVYVRVWLSARLSWRLFWNVQRSWRSFQSIRQSASFSLLLLFFPLCTWPWDPLSF